jgi:AcrR family transcriptional regulator
MENALTSAYVSMVNADAHAINPHTVAEKAGVSEADFYQHFPSVEAIGSRVWLDLGKEVAQILQESEAYRSYPARQKVLSYFFTFFDVALKHRTFVSKTWCQEAVTKAYKDEFKLLMSELVREGIDSDDIKDRLTLSSQYPKVLWELHQKLVGFWLKDQSEGFTDTEKAVESYSRLPLELMGPNLFDTVLDTFKFELERRNIRMNIPFRMS